jgi:UDP-N-acetyl-2-amino-2-deoxyglucuronate dehydrogenase
MKRFVLLGAAGFVAPRHMRAIRDTGNELAAAMDPNDSVGVLDSHFPNATFFTTFEELSAFVQQQADLVSPVDYYSVCSPNHLHEAHITAGLHAGCNVICEKPLVLNAEAVDRLVALEANSPGSASTILQLRLHPTIIGFRDEMQKAAGATKTDVDLTYITSRGNWFQKSWKGQEEKSGGIAANIGIHFFDMLCWVFGPVQEVRLHSMTPMKAAGYLEFANARVRWFLSIDRSDLPDAATDAGKATFRNITINSQDLEFSDGFVNLHTQSYGHILDGGGYPVSEARQAIEIVERLRHMKPVTGASDQHPMLIGNA